ncbi:MAG: START-like domain-containing protein [Bacteroidota bacterium]
MAKHKYTTEREFLSSPRQLFPYLSTPVGLSEWFADRVEILEKKSLNIFWDNAPHRAKIVAQRANQMIRFQFEPTQEGESPAYLEFRLSYNDFTESTFLAITDFSEMQDEDELDSLWTNLIDDLKDLLGESQA